MNEFKLSVTPDEDVSAILPSYFMYKATVGVSVMTAEQMETHILIWSHRQFEIIHSKL